MSAALARQASLQMTKPYSSRTPLHDLSGLWTGFYAYDLTDDAVPFTAWLSEDEGTITGSVLEEDITSPEPDGECTSEIIGERHGLDVRFTKIETAGPDGSLRLLRYQGDTDPECCVISGVWFFDDPSESSGTFMMTRISGELKALVQPAAARQGSAGRSNED